TLTGQVYGQPAGEGDKSLSQTVAELIASLDSKNDKDKELIAKLTALKNKLDGLSVSDIEVVEKPLTEFLKSDECETAYEFTSKFGGELNSALTSLNALAVGTVDENGEKVNLYSEFANTESIYKMTHQASLICELAAEYQTLAADYDLFGGLKELDAKLNFANVSEDYIASLREACSLIEVNEKLYDYSNGETIIFNANVSNVDELMESLKAPNAIAESYAANASNLSSEWDSDCRILTMLFTIVLAIDGAIIVAYWIGEVFKDRAKCLRDNDKKIKNLLQ
ncbi:MAG: hypothetical protein K2H30_00525, partial [Clostridia bacterium]|nr:hypothetical protein [Clostridia bacterium]